MTLTPSRTSVVIAIVLALAVPAMAKSKTPKKKPAPKPAATVPEAAKPAEKPAAPRRPGDLSPEAAANFAALALACVDRPYPYKSDRVLEDPNAVREPKLDHPIFYGCFDWHSAAHGHWMLARLARLYPEMPFAARARQALAAHLTQDRVLAEASFLGSDAQKLFERPYGWAWALRLAAELHAWNDAEAQDWAREFAPVERLLVGRFKEYLPKLPFPVRQGQHPNTAFALAQALDYAHVVKDEELAALVVKRSKEFYGADRACPVMYEPSGEDFFSPCLLEADLMRRVLAPADFATWLDGFLPGLATGDVGNLAQPAQVTDASDGKIVHLDGLNLVRAWTLKGIAAGLPAADPRRPRLLELAGTHAATGLSRVASGHYEGEHWLASFAVYLSTDVGL